MNTSAGASRFEVRLISGHGAELSREGFKDPAQAMRAFAAIRHSIRHPSRVGAVGVGGYVALVDRECVYDASYKHEGHGVFQEQFRASARELADQLLREDLTSSERWAETPAATLSAERLSWGVARALGFRIAASEPVWTMRGQCYGVAGMNTTGYPVFDPAAAVSRTMARRCFEAEGIGAHMIADGHWRAVGGDFVADGPDEVTAGLRALVMKHLGDMVAVPQMLPVVVMENEPLVGAVIAQRLAAHFSDSLGWPVQVSRDLSGEGGYRVDAGTVGVPVRPGAPGYPGMRAMECRVGLAEALAIAKQYPATHLERECRSDALQAPASVGGAAEDLLQRDAKAALRSAMRSCAVKGDALDAGHWQVIEWQAASTLARYPHYTPQAVAEVMGRLSPASVLSSEIKELQGNLDLDLERWNAIRSGLESAVQERENERTAAAAGPAV